MFVLAAAIIGALARRWFGGGFFSASRNWRVFALLTLSTIVVFMATWDVYAAPLGTWVGITWTLGHGSYMDMGTEKRRDNEFLRPLLDWWFGPEPPYSASRDATGMTLVYSIFTITGGAGLVVLGHAGWWVMATGPLVALTRWVAVRFEIPDQGARSEYAAGALIYGALAAV